MQDNLHEQVIRKTPDHKWYMATYKSDGNIGSYQTVLVGKFATLPEAQTAFFDWLSKQSVYNHLWNLEVKFSSFDKVCF